MKPAEASAVEEPSQMEIETPSQTEIETHQLELRDLSPLPDLELRDLSPLPDLGSDAEVMRAVRKKSRNLWGMYSTTVLGADGAGSRQFSPTRGAQELGRRLRQSTAKALGEVGCLRPLRVLALTEAPPDQVGASAVGSSASPVLEATAEEDLVATLPISESDERRGRADSSESAEVPEPFEVLRARQRAARAREHAAQVVARAREERIAAAIAAKSIAAPQAQEDACDEKPALEKTTPEAAEKPAFQKTQVRRRRILTKQKDPTSFQPAKESASPLGPRPTPLRNLKRQVQVALLTTPPCSKQPRAVAQEGQAAKNQAA